MTLPDDELSLVVARDVLSGVSYPLPLNAEPKMIVDVGAHAGTFSVMAAMQYPEATVHAFEPHRATCEILRANTRRLGNVVVHEQAIGLEEGKNQLYLSEHGSACSSLLRDQMQSPNGQAVEVSVAAAQVLALLRPDILKLDCEGLEVECLEGMGDYGNVDVIYVEFHTESDRQKIDAMLTATHTLNYARILQWTQGELAYLHRRPRTVKRVDGMRVS